MSSGSMPRTLNLSTSKSGLRLKSHHSFARNLAMRRRSSPKTVTGASSLRSTWQNRKRCSGGRCAGEAISRLSSRSGSGMRPSKPSEIWGSGI